MRHLVDAGLVVVVVVLGLSVFSSTALAGDYPSLSTPPEMEQTGQNDAVLVVGVGDYAFLPDVDGVVETINDWETFFVQGLGIPASQVFTLLDERATKERMEDFADRAVDAVGDGGNLWFVFVGHGAPTTDGDDGVLVGADAQSEPRSLEARGLPRSELVGILEKGDQAQTLVFIDTCFSGQSSQDDALAEGMQPVVPDRADETFEPRGTTLVMTAAQSDQFAGALPDAQRPAFSYVLLGALRGWASADEEVTASEAIHYARQHLRHLDHSQTPGVEGNDELVLVRGATEQEPGLAGAMQAALRGTVEAEDEVSTSVDGSEDDDGGLDNEMDAEHQQEVAASNVLAYHDFQQAQEGAEQSSEELRRRHSELEEQNSQMSEVFTELIDQEPDDPDRPDWMLHRVEQKREMEYLDFVKRRAKCLNGADDGRGRQDCRQRVTPDFDDILGDYQAVLSDYPDYDRTDEVLFRIATIYVGQDEYEKAYTHLSRLVRGFPNSRYFWEALTFTGDVFLAKGMFGTARDNYTEALEQVESRSAESDLSGYLSALRGYLWYRLGWVEHLSENSKESKKYWGKAVAFVRQELSAEFHRDVLDSLPDGVDTEL